MLAALICNLPEGGSKKSHRERQERLELLVELFDRNLPEPERSKISRKVSAHAEEVREVISDIAPEREADVIQGIAQIQASIAMRLPPDPSILQMLMTDLMRIQMIVQIQIDDEDAITALLLA